MHIVYCFVPQTPGSNRASQNNNNYNIMKYPGNNYVIINNTFRLVSGRDSVGITFRFASIVISMSGKNLLFLSYYQQTRYPYV